jgi:hypothetical protein
MAFSSYPAKGGIPSGNTAGRPSNPVIGDTYYNGEQGILEIYDGTTWSPCSSPSGIPTMTIADVGTSRAFTSGAIAFTFTPNPLGGAPLGFTGVATSGVPVTYTTGSTTTTTPTLTVAGPGTYQVSGTAYNAFGTSPSTSTQSLTVTTVPEAPTIGTATDTQSSQTLSVTFTAGNNGGKSISNYQYQLNGAGSYTAFSPAQTTSPLTISGLTNGTSYTVKLKAVNANGASAESTSSNSATPTNSVTVDYLVVAGGGGGGMHQAGGGGAGGLRSTVTATGGTGSLETALALNKSTNYTVTVGGGGTAVWVDGSNDQGGAGSNSVFSTITSDGGGGGGGYYNVVGGGNGGNGGSGGGGGSSSQNSGTSVPGTGISTQGYGGGTSILVSPHGGGGGGGASAAGQNAYGNNGQPGNGGNGRAVSITGSSVTYAGGGGGSAVNNLDSRQVATGGTGGGGAGGRGDTNAAVAGTVNTGGGGGGESQNVNGAGGGSGVVILRWLTSQGSITVGAGLTADSTGTDGSYSYKRFTAGSGNVSFA